MKAGYQLLKEASEKYYPENSEVFFYLGYFADKVGDTQQVIKALRRSIELNPKNPDALNYLAYFYASNGINLRVAKSLVE